MAKFTENQTDKLREAFVIHFLPLSSALIHAEMDMRTFKKKWNNHPGFQKKILEAITERQKLLLEKTSSGSENHRLILQCYHREYLAVSKNDNREKSTDMFSTLPADFPIGLEVIEEGKESVDLIDDCRDLDYLDEPGKKKKRTSLKKRKK